MEFEKFQKRLNEGIYNIGDKFWVCDVRSDENKTIGKFMRKLKPTEVICLMKPNQEIYFVKTRKDGLPSKSTVSIYGPALNAQPFLIFETKDDAEKEYIRRLKRIFMEIDRQFDTFKTTCSVALGRILKDLQDIH